MTEQTAIDRAFLRQALDFGARGQGTTATNPCGGAIVTQDTADGPVIVGRDCADPYSPKAVRASMGSIFARPPARGRFDELPGTRVAFVTGADPDWTAEAPVVLCFGSERGDLPEGAEITAGIPMRGELDSLNVAMAATVALYDRFRMARHG